MSTVTEELRKLARLHEHLAKHRALVINRKNGKHGTGILIDMGGKLLVLTARHVIEKASQDQIYINLGLDHQEDPLETSSFYLHPELDWAYVELTKRAYDFCRDEKTEAFPVNKPDRFGQEKDRIPMEFAIWGYPGVCTIPLSRHRFEARGYMFAGLRMLRPESWPQFTNKYNESRHIVLPYSRGRIRANVDQYGNVVEPIDPRGMSGAALWAYDLDSFGADRPRYALAGIQSALVSRRDGDYLICVHAITAFEQIAQQFGLDWMLSIDNGAGGNAGHTPK